MIASCKVLLLNWQVNTLELELSARCGVKRTPSSFDGRN